MLTAASPTTVTQAFADLSVVQLVTSVVSGGKVLKAGTSGTVVYVHNDGQAYEVEFFDEDAAVVTLMAAQLTQ